MMAAPATARWTRLAFRASLFALFAGCGLSLAGEGDLVINPNEIEAGNKITTGDRQDLFAVDPKDLTFDEANPTPVSFTVRLTQQPTASVTIPLKVLGGDRLVTEPGAVLFQTDNWDKPQSVSIRLNGTNSVIDPSTFTVALDTVTSGDPSFNGANPVDVKVFFKDANEAINIYPRKTPAGENFQVSEKGTETKFFAQLAAQPDQDVTVTCRVANKEELGIASVTGSAGSDAGADGGSDAGASTFTTEALVVFPKGTPVGIEREFRVKGLDDKAADGNRTVAIDCSATSADLRFDSKTAPSLFIDNIDDDSPNILTSTGTLAPTSEASGGTTQSFTVTLATQPTADVTLTVAASDSTEATVQGPNTVVFTDKNWDKPQTVTIKGLDDGVTDGDIDYSITLTPTSADPKYQAVSPATISGRNLDNEVAGIVTTPSTGPITTTEAGGTAVIQVKLNAQPTGDVVINVASSRTSEGTVSTNQLTFTPSNWDTPLQVVTVTGVNDAIDDGNQNYNVTFTIDVANTQDAKYKLLATKTVSATNTDNDTAAVVTTPASLGITENGSNNFDVVLATQPVGTVIVRLTPSVPVLAGASGMTITPAFVDLTFNDTNWNISQPATFNYPQDCYFHHPSIPVAVTVLGSSTDTTYKQGGTSTPDVSLAPADNEGSLTPTIAVSTTALSMSKNGTGTFNISLNTRWRATVDLLLQVDKTRATFVGGVDNGANNELHVVFDAGDLDTSCPPVAKTITVNAGNTTVTAGDNKKIIINADNTTVDPDYRTYNPVDVGYTIN